MNSEADARGVTGREWAVLCLVVAGIVVGRGRGFEGMISNDNVAMWLYSWREVWPALEELRRPSTFHWPPLYPWLVGGCLWLFGDALGTFWPRLISGLSAVLFAAGVLRLGLASGLSRTGARAAAALCLAGGLVWQMTLVVSADLLSQALVLWGFVSVLGALRGESTGWAKAGAWFGLALLSRWAILIHGLTVAGFWLIGAYRCRREAGAGGNSLMRWSFQGALGGVVFACAVGVLLWSRQAGAGPYAPGEGSWSAIWTVESWFGRVFETRDGLLSYRLPNLVYYLVAPIHPSVLGPFAVLLPIGLLRVLREGSAERWLLLVFWPATLVLFLAGFELQNPRFVLMLVPPTALLAVCGAVELYAVRSLGARGRRWARRVVVVGLLILVTTAWQRSGRLMHRAVARIAVADAALSTRREAPEDPPILSSEVTPWIRWRWIAAGAAEPVDSQLVELHETEPARVVELVRRRGGALLVHDPETTRNQWRDRPAGLAVQALSAAPDLTSELVAEIGRWRIDRISLAASGGGDSDRRSPR